MSPHNHFTQRKSFSYAQGDLTTDDFEHIRPLVSDSLEFSEVVFFLFCFIKQMLTLILLLSLLSKRERKGKSNQIKLDTQI